MRVVDATTAFIAATKNELFGKRVNVYSVSRQLAAQSMGMRFGFLSENDQIRFSETGAYDGIFLDAVLVGWLCSVDDETVMDSIMSPVHAKSLAVKWAESEAIAVGSEKFTELIAFYVYAVSSVQKSEFDVKTSSSNTVDVKTNSPNTGGND